MQQRYGKKKEKKEGIVYDESPDITTSVPTKDSDNNRNIESGGFSL